MLLVYTPDSSPCVFFNLDPPPAPVTAVPVRQLRSTLDGKHWALDEAKRPFCRSLPPIDQGRAPVKPRALSPARDTIPSRVLFPSTSASTSSGPPPPASSGATPASASSGGDPPVSASSGGAPPVILGASALSSVVSAAGSDSAEDDGDGDNATIIYHSPEPSFLDDFAPPGLSGSDLIAGSTAVLQTTASVIHTTASAINTTASAVRHMFSSDPARSRPHDAPPEDPPPARDPRDARPPRDTRDPFPARDQPPRNHDPNPPSREQFTELQRQYATL